MQESVEIKMYKMKNEAKYPKQEMNEIKWKIMMKRGDAKKIK